MCTRFMWRRAATCAASAETIRGPSALADDDPHRRAVTSHGHGSCAQPPELTRCVYNVPILKQAAVRPMAAVPWLHRLQALSSMCAISRRQPGTFKNTRAASSSVHTRSKMPRVIRPSTCCSSCCMAPICLYVVQGSPIQPLYSGRVRMKGDRSISCLTIFKGVSVQMGVHGVPDKCSILCPLDHSVNRTT